MTARRMLLLLALLLGVTSAVGVAPGPASAADPQRYVDRVFTQVAVQRDVAYGAAPDEDGRRQVLEADIYTPVGDTETRRPAVVLAHGGGFVAGDKGGMAGLANGYARRGFVALSIEYRMDEGAGEIYFPPTPADVERILDAREDMQAAVRWVRDRAHVLGVDPGKVSVGGSSAGAVTALLAATMWDDPGASGTPGLSSKPCTAVSIAGAADPALVDGGDAGAIFFHGDQDTRVPYSAAVATEAAMAAAGLASEMVTFPGVGHSLNAGAIIEQRSAEWLAAEVVAGPPSCVGPIDPSHPAFVRAVFADFLGRPADADEVLEQVNRLDSGAPRAGLLREVSTSDEWVAAIVADLYEDTLGRVPDAGGLAYWTEEIRSGRRSVAQVAAALYAAPEYRRVFTGTSAEVIAAWVTDLYEEILGRTPAPAELDYWAVETWDRGFTRTATLLYGSLESRRARVAELYQHLLGRAPDAAGLAFWAEGIGRDGDLALARSLAASPEYRARAVIRFPA